MNPILRALLVPVGIGLALCIVSFISMMSAPPIPTAFLAALVYLGAGFWSGRLKIKLFWFTPLLIIAPIWIIFIPMGMEIWPPVIHIWFFLLPPGVALVSAYLGLFLSARQPLRQTTATEDGQGKRGG